MPKFLDTQRVEGRMQQSFELMCRNRPRAITLHRAHRHPNNRVLLLNLEAKGIAHRHLKRYILSVSCDACRVAIGKCDNKTSNVDLAKRERIAQQNKTKKVLEFDLSQIQQVIQTTSNAIPLRTPWIS